MLSTILACGKCGWRTTCGEDEIARRLRTLGLLRRSPHPPAELVSELLRVNAHRLTCDTCHNPGLAIVGADGGDPHSPAILAGSEDVGDWQQAVLCQICREPIPPERVEIFPDAKRCAKCQDLADRGAEPVAPEFCPKCGALLEMRVSRGGGITRYKQFCTGQPPCRL
ncbi:MAG: TraR/DksA C4-type zinc finger protein [Bythopirellula sp.]|nr:TraR/DksA C4-type zinc finger protein [Bythopirellula sp.]